MPKYTFHCEKCEQSFQRIAAPSTKELACPKCSESSQRQMPALKGINVEEIVDKTRNIAWKKDQESLIAERRADYFWSVEVPRLVSTHSLETSLENGWVYYDEKGELKIRTKPPQKQ